MTQLRSSKFADFFSERHRLEACLPPVASILREKGEGYPETRVVSSAALVLGLSNTRVRNLAKSFNRGGSTFDGYLAERRRILGSDSLPWSPEPYVGHFASVYRARMRDFPWVIKIGFSTDPATRMASLRQQTGHQHDLEEVVEGSRFDEAMSFRDRRRHHLHREWFLDHDRPAGHLPDFMLGGLTQAHWAWLIVRCRAHSNFWGNSASELHLWDLHEQENAA